MPTARSVIPPARSSPVDLVRHVAYGAGVRALEGSRCASSPARALEQRGLAGAVGAHEREPSLGIMPRLVDQVMDSLRRLHESEGRGAAAISCGRRTWG